MNRSRYLDLYQLILAVTSLAALFLSIVMFIIMIVTATPTYDSAGELDTLTYIYPIQMVFSSFVLIHLTAGIWFLARTITYKMRIKEEEAL